MPIREKVDVQGNLDSELGENDDRVERRALLDHEQREGEGRHGREREVECGEANQVGSPCAGKQHAIDYVRARDQSDRSRDTEYHLEKERREHDLVALVLGRGLEVKALQS